MSEVESHPGKRVVWPADQLDFSAFKSFVHVLPDAVAVFDTEMRNVAVSERWLSDYRLSESDIIGNSHYDDFPELPERWKALHRRALKGEALSRKGDQFVRSDGGVDWVDWELTPIVSPGDKVIGLLLYSHVATGEVEHEADLRRRIALVPESQRLEQAARTETARTNRTLQGVLDASLNGIMAFAAIRDRHGRIVDFEWKVVNRRAEALVERRAKDLIGARLLQVFPGNAREGLFDVYVDVVEKQAPAELRKHYDQDGIDLWLDISAVPLDDGFVVTFSDITPIKQAESAARFSEAKLASVLTTAPIGIMTIGADQTITMGNNEAARMFGTNVEALAGSPIIEFIPERHREGHAALARNFLAGPDQELAMSNWRVVNGLKADGGEFPMLALLRKITVDETSVTTFVCRDMTDVRDRDQKLARFAESSVRDRMRAERANAAKSRFLAAMSHELRTPLNAILGYSELMLGTMAAPETDDKKHRYLNHIHKSGMHLLTLIEGLMDIAQIETGAKHVAPQPIALQEQIRDAIEVVRPALETAEVQARIVLPDPMPKVLMDPTSLRQILINLLSNAARYVPSGGQVSVEAKLDRPPDDREAAAVRARLDRATIEVRDTGTGFSADVLAELRKPYIDMGDSMHAAEGSGLGLAIVRGLVELNGGLLVIDNAPDGGARVRITVPIASEAA